MKYVYPKTGKLGEHTKASGNVIEVIFNAMMGKKPITKKIEIELLANDVKGYLTERKKITIPDIMEKFNVTAEDAIEAVEILKKNGVAKEER